MIYTDIKTVTQEKHIFSVNELNKQAKALLESALSSVWLEGEISNLAQPRSGHLYLTLKDDSAQVRAAMFRGRNINLGFKPENGQQVLVKGQLSIYAARGDYQLIIDTMEEAGLGALQRAYEALKQKLGSEGLFDENSKAPLPEHARCIGIVTSPTGAAIHDILSVLKRRSPLTKTIIYPATVQGDEAPSQLCTAIDTANQRNECDVLIIGRGGGSLEDLWAFNSEKVARCIAASTIPVVSAVGHQVDFTIADFVADKRAATPSAAAELLSQDQNELFDLFMNYQKWLGNHLTQQLRQYKQTLTWTEKRLIHPGKRLNEYNQRLDELESRLTQNIHGTLALCNSTNKTIHAKLIAQTPVHAIKQSQLKTVDLSKRLSKSLQQIVQHHKTSLTHLAQRLNTISPLATLGRGYAIVHDSQQAIVRDAKHIKPNDEIIAKLGKGSLVCTVTRINKR